MHIRASHRTADGELTPRQREVIALMAKGRTNPEIATELGMTIDGAKWHVREILSKLGVDSREEAVRVWRGRQHGISRVLIVLGGGATAAAALVAIGLGAWLAWPRTTPASVATNVPSVTSTPAATNTTTPATPGTAIPIGKPIALNDAIARLPASEGQPEAAYDGKLIVVSSVGHFNESAQPQDTFDETFRLWDPTTGDFTPLWTTMGSMATDRVTSVDGDWAAVVGTWGDDASKWRIALHNLRTGEVRQVATQAPSHLDSGVFVGGVVSGGHLYWNAIVPSSDGTPVKRIESYSIADGTTTTLVQSPGTAISASQKLVDSSSSWSAPVAGGGKVAWVAQIGDSRVVLLLDVATGVVTQPVTNAGSDCALTADGRYLGWVNDSGMRVLDLQTGRITGGAGIANTNGGPSTTGKTFSWYPPTMGGRGGFYDPVANVARFVEQPPGTGSNVAQIIGDWFVWQILPTDDSSPGYWAIVPVK